MARREHTGTAKPDRRASALAMARTHTTMKEIIMKRKPVALRAAYDAMTPDQRLAQRRSWVVGELMLQHPDMSRDDPVAAYERATQAEEKAR